MLCKCLGLEAMMKVPLLGFSTKLKSNFSASASDRIKCRVIAIEMLFSVFK